MERQKEADGRRRAHPQRLQLRAHLENESTRSEKLTKGAPSRVSNPAVQTKDAEKYDYLHNDKIKSGDNTRKEELKSLAHAIKKKLGLAEQLNPYNTDFSGDRDSPSAASPSSPTFHDDRPSEHADKMFSSRNGRARGTKSVENVENVEVHADTSEVAPAAFQQTLPRLNFEEVMSPRAEYLVSSERDTNEPNEDIRSRRLSIGAIPSPGTAFSPRGQ